jgi:hypothetical protein
MSDDKDPKPLLELHELELDSVPFDPRDPKWAGWLLELRVAIQDQDAVLRDQLRKKRQRNLGPREARRLYREARDKLRDLLVLAGGGGDDGDGGDKGGRDPAPPADS